MRDRVERVATIIGKVFGAEPGDGLALRAQESAWKLADAGMLARPLRESGTVAPSECRADQVFVGSWDDSGDRCNMVRAHPGSARPWTVFAARRVVRVRDDRVCDLVLLVPVAGEG